MTSSRPVLAIDHLFTTADYGNRAFDDRPAWYAPWFRRAFRDFMDRRGVDVVTLDTVDFEDPAVRYVLFFDYSWRHSLKDPFLQRVPRAKRALMLIEPASTNPSMYWVPWWRDRFNIVFTYDRRLLRHNPGYAPCIVPLWAEPPDYRENPFLHMTFVQKRILVAISGNHRSFIPQTTYGLRRRTYGSLAGMMPLDFDLYGRRWDMPIRGLSQQRCGQLRSVWKGEIPDDFSAKTRVLSRYRFALVIENGVSQPGYVSEKMIDCLCARCVPVYYGSEGAEDLVPRSTWIDFRSFRRMRDLVEYVSRMPEDTYSAYISAIDRFLDGPALSVFSTHAMFAGIADRLGFPDMPEKEPGTRS